MLVFLDGAEEDLSDYLAILILADDQPDGLRVLLPHLEGNEGRVSEHEIEEVVVLLRDGLGVVEVVLVVIGVVLLELEIVLREGVRTSKRKTGPSWLGLSMA